MGSQDCAHYRQYLNLYATWQAAGLQEDIRDFAERVSPDEPDLDAPSPDGLPWRVGHQSNHKIKGIRGNGGSVQKDWCIVDGNLLPQELGIAVIGRQGWERDLEATLPYALAVSIEPVSSRIPIYAEIKERVVVPVEVEEQIDIKS